MKVLVTGISGRIGGNLAYQLKQQGYEVRGLIMPNDPKEDKVRRLGVEMFVADMNDAEGVYRAVDGVDMVAHMAAQMRQGNSTPQRMFEINLMGTINVFEGVLRSRTKVKRVLFSSTDQAYSPFVSQKTTFTEDHPQDPIDIYGLTKAMGEQAVAEYRREYGMPIVTTRYGSVLAGDEALTVLSADWLHNFLHLWTDNGRVPWFGADKVEAAFAAVKPALKVPNAVCGFTDPNGVSWGLPFSDVRDTVRGIILALEHPRAVNEVFSIVGPETTEFVPAAKLIASKTDRPYVEVRMPFLWWFGVSIDKARRVLGYEPEYDFAGMVESALAIRQGEDIGVIPV
jgi:UDP-glucose 4-epimerase